MKALSTLILSAMGFAAMAQTAITNGGFETWGNTSPGLSTEPTNWYSDKSGSSTATLGPQTCFEENTIIHSGSHSVKVETESVSIIVTEYVNGVVTTGVVNAPTTNKADGYIGTVNYSTSSDDRRMAFTGRPDSLVGWYQYVQSTTTTGTGGANERGKIRAILHTGDYYDPETPTTYHVDPTANKIADALFLTPMANVSTWTRFSVPFNYVSTATPAYIMINVTSSANQLTSVAGSILYLDDLDVIYPTSTCDTVTGLAAGLITGTGATLSWTAVSGSAGYVYAVNTSATPPASGTFTTSTSAAITGLTAATLYYAHVKDSCGAGNASAWVTKPFGTTGFNSGVNNVASGNFGITAFPNPVKGELIINITGAANSKGQVQLMDVSGRLMKTAVVDANTLTMDLSGLSSGIYFARYTDSGHTQTIKIVKE